MDHSQKRIAAIFADIGTFDCLYPVVKILQNTQEVTLFVDPEGTAKKAFTQFGISAVETTEVDVNNFDLVLCGTNGKALTLQRNITLAVNEEQKKRPLEIVWCGDFYLSGCEKKMRDLTPDWLTQIDESARDLAVELRPDIPPERIVTLGNPSFDRIVSILKEREKLREKVRGILGLDTSQKLVLFSASASNQFETHEMEKTLDDIFSYCRNNRSIFLVYSFHPADPHKTKWQNFVSNFAPETSTLIKDRITEDSLVDMAAADAVIVQYSTEGVKASLMVPTAFVLLPSMRAYQNTRGGSWKHKFFPQIKHWTAESIWDDREIAPALDRMLYGEPDYYEALEDAREKHFHFLRDGRSTERFINFVEQLLEIPHSYKR